MAQNYQDYENALKYGAVIIGSNIANSTIQGSNVATGTILNANIGTATIAGAKTTPQKYYNVVAVQTNATQTVNFIAGTVPFACTVTGAFASFNGVAGGTTTITIADTAG